MPHRTPRLPVLVLAALVIVASALAATPASAAASHNSRWSLTRDVCSRPSNPSAFRCFAQRSVDVAAGTAGASRTPLAAVGHGPTGGYSPTDLARAYGFNPRTKVNQTVAVVDWYDDPYALADLDVFDRHYGLHTETAASFRKVNESGRTSPLPAASRTSSGEITLDIEAVRAVCNACRIVLVEASKPSNNDLASAENTAARLGATEISNSWGGAEGSENTALVNSFKHPGIVITASTGDDGWYGWDYVNDGSSDSDNAPSFPASSPYVVAVAGTTLSVNSAGARTSETVWNDNGNSDSTGSTYDPSAQSAPGASGGGCSRRQSAPYWQSHEAGYGALGCKGRRSAADLAALASPSHGLDVFDRYGGQLYSPGCSTAHPTNACWGRAGGTSLSSPVVAALYALAGGSGGSAYPAASLYVNANRSPSSRYDITSGGNAYCGNDSTSACSANVYTSSRYTTNNPNGLVRGDLLDCSFAASGADINPLDPPARSAQCNATTGFDGPSGLGAPTGLRLFANTSPQATIFLPKAARHGRSATYRASLRTTSGARIASVSWSWGDGKASSGSARAARVTHTYRRAGTYRITFAARDTFGQLIYRYRTVRVG